MCQIYHGAPQGFNREERVLGVQGMSETNIKFSHMRSSGISIIEAIIALAILCIITVGTGGILTLLSNFGIYSKKNYEMSCMIWSLSSAVEACRGGVMETKFYCKDKKIIVTLQGECPPQSGQCSVVEVSGGNYKLKDRVCNFREN